MTSHLRRLVLAAFFAAVAACDLTVLQASTPAPPLLPFEQTTGNTCKVSQAPQAAMDFAVDGPDQATVQAGPFTTVLDGGAAKAQPAGAVSCAGAASPFTCTIHISIAGAGYNTAGTHTLALGSPAGLSAPVSYTLVADVGVPRFLRFFLIGAIGALLITWSVRR